MENSIEFAGLPISDFIFIIIVYEKNANNNKNIWKFFFEGKWQIKLCHWFLESFLPFQRLLSQIICVFSNQYALGKLIYIGRIKISLSKIYLLWHQLLQ